MAKAWTECLATSETDTESEPPLQLINRQVKAAVGDRVWLAVWKILIARCNVEAPCPNEVQIFFLRIPQRVHAKYFSILLASFQNMQDQSNVCTVKLMTPRWTDDKWNPLANFEVDLSSIGPIENLKDKKYHK